MVKPFPIFNGVGIIFSVIFIFAFGIIIFGVIKGIMQWDKNNHSPRLTVAARIVAKRTQVSNTHHNTGTGTMHMSSFTSYYVTFQVESKDRIELRVNSEEYGMLAEGDFGRLSFQGTRYLGFERMY